MIFLSNRPLFYGQNSTGQNWNSGTDLGLAMTADLVDNWSGHNTVNGAGAYSSQYFCQAPGWYLARSSIPFTYTGSTQYVFAGGFSGQTAGAAFTTVRGALTLGGSTHDPLAQCCDLIRMTESGPTGGGGDFINFTAFQNTGSSITLANTATELPYVVIRWVAATSGTTPLIVPANASWPIPPAAYITSAFLNTSIRDTIRFLTYPPICKAYGASGSLPSQSFPSGSVVPLANTPVDNYSGFTTGTGGGYTAPVAGVYFVYGQFSLAASTGSTAYCAGLSVNGGSTQWGDSVNKISDTTGGGAQVGKHLRLNAGDTVQFIACQGSGSSIAWNGAGINQTRFIAVWESS